MNYKFLNAYIYGNNLNFFKNQFRKKISYQTFHNLDKATKKALIDIKKNKYTKNKTLLFSPSAASFDMFKNFEVRGEKFNNIIKRFRDDIAQRGPIRPLPSGKLKYFMESINASSHINHMMYSMNKS